ncbi:MAG: cytochrome c3 family protein, partial [Candidatus Zixiibacteriota bacterium]
CPIRGRGRLHRATSGRGESFTALVFPIATLLAIAVLIWAPMTDTHSASRAFSPESIEAAEMCLDCHEDQAESLAHTAHAVSPAIEEGELSCIDCHANAIEHVDDPDAENIGNPATMHTEQIDNLCSSCHMPHTDMDNAGLDPHLGQDFDCLACHGDLHSSDSPLSGDPTALCGKCHERTLLEFQRRSNHPVTDGAATCLSCHTFTGDVSPQYGYGSSASCYECHPENSGPYLYEHDATKSFAVQGEGCVACHSPHGSVNDRLLNAPDNNLCLQCHALPPQHRTRHSGLGAKMGCVDCHSEIHGSNHNSMMLDPDLGIKLASDCYQAGCHAVGN